MRSLLLCLLLLLPAQAWAEGSIILDDANDSLEMLQSVTANLDVSCDWVDITTTAMTPGNSNAQGTTAATTITIVAAPGASTQRQIKSCNIRNVSTTLANLVTLKYDDNATERILYSTTLAPSETLKYDGMLGYITYTANGVQKSVAVQNTGIGGFTQTFIKNGSAIDTIGYWYMAAKDAGNPGAWLPPATGVDGADTDCSTASNNADPFGAVQMGMGYLPDPATGSWYLSQAVFQSSVTGVVVLVDVVYLNTTAFTLPAGAQNFTSGAFLARDQNGSADGEGYQPAFYALTTLGNAAAVSTSTITYVDSDNNSGNTGTLQGVVGLQWPVTPLIGTVVPITLSTGDRGVRSISSLNTGTTLTSGTFGLMVYRVLATIPITVANIPSALYGGGSNVTLPGIKVHNNSCITALWTGPATTAPIIIGSYTLTNQ